MTILFERVIARALGEAPRDTQRVRLSQRGTMRLKEGARWTPFEATQWIDARTCAFRWEAKLKMAPMLRMHVVDALEDGRGHLVARLWNMLPLARAEGPTVTVGELMRYMAELPWCPHAYRNNPELSFEAVADDRIRVTANAAGGAASLDLLVDATGDVVGMSAQSRPRTEGRATVDRPWSAVLSDHATMDGVRLPRRGVVSWTLPSGVFETFRGEIVDWRCEVTP